MDAFVSLSAEEPRRAPVFFASFRRGTGVVRAGCMRVCAYVCGDDPFRFLVLWHVNVDGTLRDQATGVHTYWNIQTHTHTHTHTHIYLYTHIYIDMA